MYSSKVKAVISKKNKSASNIHKVMEMGYKVKDNTLWIVDHRGHVMDFDLDEYDATIKTGVKKTIYTVTEFDTKTKKLTLLVRGTEQEAKEQIEYEINCLKERENVLESKMDYPPDERISLGINEHNGYCKTEDAEYFWHTDCIVETVFDENF